ncbi:demethylmenaquinone methyltransferase / 2-methoxy-6-polyprenyl-1,4-benzoquinol methylase [Amycolatopsis arida]|uniref:Demethylmenaquinone methyltransferase n=1 Tax=Amycolatopsis arida TaxID=587909 RepID=A0A1I6A750_9PSEU|nr:demethylmenaquinone methyltransferase [Amycolatopsis arida]TDX88557.1 demethylmenaquinone methyltransferase/2-methoxy-6-polyprenyl-1,4-benzoquinol methylase [Amycolatopsis arida]SFQ64529.1 demethylmenaquinone methyltransferase / 2-methoxy-6-polyprenyl-1,4-benzoquinol methylase [Amycolatopsis arida]
MSRASLDKDPREVAAMFDDVASGYDRANSVMTFGFDRRWRVTTARVLDARPGERVLDLAAGTGVSTEEYAQGGAWCLAADFSLGMLRAGRHRGVPMVAADALRLPFADGSFDAATISLGIRNFVDTRAALEEIRRVVRPGGRLVICEVSTPPFAPIRLVYRRVVLRALTWLGRRSSSNPDAYGYLAESMLAWPNQREFAEIIASAGWANVEWLNLTFGVVAIHRARKPEA